MKRASPRVAHSSFHSSGSISNLESPGGGSVGILTYQSMSVILHFGKLSIPNSLGVEHAQPFLARSG